MKLQNHKKTCVYFLLYALTACSASYYAKDADREVEKILQALDRDYLQNLPKEARYPQPQEQGQEADEAQAQLEQILPEQPQAQELSLMDALHIAIDNNRNYQTQRETLYQAALALTLVQYNFGPRFNSTISYLLSDANRLPAQGDANVSLSGNTILPTGAQLQVNSQVGVAGEEGVGLDTQRLSTGSITTTLSQPLWRGAGYEVSHEQLTQAQRSTVYAVRGFELFRQDFSIDVLTRFYDLVSQERRIKNQQSSYEQFQFLRRRSEALFNVGRVPNLDVLRARQQELSAEDNLIQAREAYESTLDQFKIFLGLDPKQALEIRDEQPEFVPVRIDEVSAIEAALANRLDLQTVKERLEDAQRALRIAKDGLVPDLNLDVSQTFASAGDSPFNDLALAREQSWSAGLFLNLPLDRKAERNAYRNALINLDQQRRTYDLEQDNVKEEVRRTLRRLRRAENAIRIQQMIIESERKRVKIAQIRFEAGEIENRDVVEAQQGLLDAENSLVEEIVSHEISRIQLLRDLGILFLGPNGLPLE